MKKFKIKYTVDVTVDSWENGQEIRPCNYYDGVFEVDTKNYKEAIQKFFKNELFFDVDTRDLSFETVLDGFSYDVLVDNDNSEVKYDDVKFDLWQNGEIELYNAYIHFNIYEVNETLIKGVKND